MNLLLIIVDSEEEWYGELLVMKTGQRRNTYVKQYKCSYSFKLSLVASLDCFECNFCLNIYKLRNYLDKKLLVQRENLRNEY
jgi:hypothetical protein